MGEKKKKLKLVTAVNLDFLVSVSEVTQNLNEKPKPARENREIKTFYSV